MTDSNFATLKEEDTSTGSDVYQRIKECIMTSVFPGGAHLREIDLAEQFGTSRTPIREAIVRLEAEGLVQIVPRRGITVSSINDKDMREIYDILMMLESLAAGELAKQKPSKKILTGMFDAMKIMEDAEKKDDIRAWALGDDMFHREMVRLSGNSRLISITDALYAQAHRTLMITLRIRSSLDVSNQEHQNIMTFIVEGDEEGAAAAMRQHRLRGGEENASILENYKLPPL